MYLFSENINNKYDIIGVTEVYPKNCRYSPGKAELQLLGYELFLNESGENKRGIALYTVNQFIFAAIMFRVFLLQDSFVEI